MAEVAAIFTGRIYFSTDFVVFICLAFISAYTVCLKTQNSKLLHSI